MFIKSIENETYAFVDVETNGSSASYGQIIEIAIVKVEHGKITEKFQSLVRPDRRIPPFITGITGITDEVLENAPTFEEIALKVRELLSDAVFVAHNARFDYSFVKSEFKRLDISWNAKTLCTVKLSRKLYPEQKSHNLDSIIERHGIAMKNRHRAYDDTVAMIEFIKSAEKELGTEAVQSVILHGLKAHALPAAIDPGIIDALPHAPGVYFFFGADDALLYIGKSIDIKNRVRSHFSQDYTSTKERTMMQETARIEYEETPGELSALLKESALIKEHEPVYNRKLRKEKKLAVILAGKNPDGYKTATVEYIDDFEDTSLQNILGVFRSARQGKESLKNIQSAYNICPKMLSLESGPGSCFYTQLNKCGGACMGNEDVRTYNERFDGAFIKTRLKAWPYSGAIIVPEDPEAEEGLAYVIENWRIIKTAHYSSDGLVESEENADTPFDYDSYKILAAHLLRPGVQKNIKPYLHSSDHVTGIHTEYVM